MDNTVILGVVFICIALVSVAILATVGRKPRERRIEVEDWKVESPKVWRELLEPSDIWPDVDNRISAEAINRSEASMRGETLAEGYSKWPPVEYEDDYDWEEFDCEEWPSQEDLLWARQYIKEHTMQRLHAIRRKQRGSLIGPNIINWISYRDRNIF